MALQKNARPGRVTVPNLRESKGRAERIAVVTAYDATFARMIDEAGADIILIGDSLGMVVQGRETTLPVTLDEMIYHARAVARGTVRAHLVADMPFMTYQVNEQEALKNAGKLLSEGGVHAVKLEGGRAMGNTIARIVDAGIPVMGHVGLTPQSVHAMGGFRLQGRTEQDAARILEDARAVERAGAYALVLESMPAELAARITAELSIPTIGIGAGPSCDGQVLVCYDLLGLSGDRTPKFVDPYERMYTRGVQAVGEFCRDVRDGTFATAEHRAYVE